MDRRIAKIAERLKHGYVGRDWRGFSGAFSNNFDGEAAGAYHRALREAERDIKELLKVLGE